MAPRRMLLMLLSLAVAIATIAAAVDLPVCAKSRTADLPSDDVAACGMDNSALFQDRAALYRERKCQSPACMRLYAVVDTANPSECQTAAQGSFSLRLREGILAPLYATCATLANPTTAPLPPPPAATTPTAGGPSSSTPTVRETRAPPPTSPSPSPSTTIAAPTDAVDASAPTPPSDSGSSSKSSPPSDASTPNETDGAETGAPPTAPDTDTPNDASSSASASETNPTSSRAAQRTSPPAAQPVAVSTKASGSTQTPVLVGAAVAVVLLVGIAVRWKYRTRAQRKRPADVFGDTTTDEDLTTAYATSTDGGSDGSGANLVSSHWRHEMESQLRGDATLELWRVSAGTITTKRLLGRGSHAFVHLVAASDGTLLASKRLAIDQITPKEFTQLVGEAHIVSTLQHRSIVTFAGVAWTSPLDFQVLFEFMEGGDLRTYLDKNTPSADSSTSSTAWSPLKLQMALAIAEGLTYAHSFNPPLVHRDLKSRNILLTRSFEAKISDFGVSRFLSDNDTMTTGMGTTRWLAPEVISGGGTYNELCDIYSFGVVLTELDTHDVPLASEMEAARHDGKKRSELWLLQEIARGHLRPSLSMSCPHEIRELATQCLSLDAAERPNALEISHRLRSIVSVQRAMSS